MSCLKTEGSRRGEDGLKSGREGNTGSPTSTLDWCEEVRCARTTRDDEGP